MNFYVGKNGQQLGPFTQDQVRSMLDGGLLGHADLAWHEGVPDWAPLGQLLGLAPSPSLSDSAPASQPFTAVQPASFQQAAYQTPAAPDEKAGKGVIIGGYVCAALSILILPIIFGPVGVALGILALTRKETGHGLTIIILSGVLSLFGFLIGMAATAG